MYIYLYIDVAVVLLALVELLKITFIIGLKNKMAYEDDRAWPFHMPFLLSFFRAFSQSITASSWKARKEIRTFFFIP